MSIQDGTYGGNDSIVAFARLHKLTVVIHQLDSPAWEVHGETADGKPASKSLVRQLHISYHNGDHYASVRSVNDNSDSPANVHMTPQTPASAASQAATNRHAQLAGMTSLFNVVLYLVLIYNQCMTGVKWLDSVSYTTILASVSRQHLIHTLSDS